MIDLKLNIPSGYYTEEVKCDYTVKPEVKKIWAVELDLLAEFDRVCQKNHIIYYACAGTVLGAVRHKGFIPWDDDIDVMLLRNEYDKLCAISSDFQSPYFFQTEQTDPYSMRGHAQLRNSKTTAILKDEFSSRYPFNQGIFIDIFPLDNMPDNAESRLEFINKLSKIKNKAQKERDYELGINNSNGIKKVLKKVAFKSKLNKKIHSRETYQEFENELKKFNDKNTKTVGIGALLDERFCVNRRLLGKPVKVNFEMLEIPVPEKYDDYLTKLYGDWHKLIKGASVHQGVIFDTDKPYEDYIR